MLLSHTRKVDLGVTNDQNNVYVASLTFDIDTGQSSQLKMNVETIKGDRLW